MWRENINVAVGFLESFVADAAMSLMFGVGYYLFQKFKSDKKENLKADNVELHLNFVKSQDSIYKWNSAKTILEFNELIEADYDGIVDPLMIISLLNRRGIFPNIETYNKLLLKCSMNNNLESENLIRREIFDDLGPVQPDVSTLNILITCRGRKYTHILKKNQEIFTAEDRIEHFKKFDEELIELIESMEKRNIFIDVSCQNSIMEALVKMKRGDDLWNQYINMRKKFTANYLTFDIMIKGLVKLCPVYRFDGKNFSKILEIFSDAKPVYQIDQESFHWLIESCLASNKIDHAEQFISERKEQKLKILEKTYLSMIMVYGHMLDLDKAFEFFDELKFNLFEDGRTYPSSQVYYTLVNSCVNSGDILLAESLIEEMTLYKVEKCSSIYITMIKGYKNVKNFSRAIELYDYLISDTTSQIISDVDCFNSLLECCLETKNYKKMDIIYENFYKASNLQFNLNTYLILLKGYVIRDLPENVYEIYTFLNIDNELTLPDHLYDLILQCFSRNNNQRYLQLILTEIKSKQIKICQQSYESLIKHLCIKEDCNKAYELFHECIKSSYKPSKALYSIVIILLIKHKLIDRAITIFRNMIITNLNSDPHVYIQIIKVCFEYNRQKEAAEFITQAVKDEVNLDGNLYSELRDCLQKDNEEFKPLEKYHAITSLIAALNDSKINLDKIIINDFCKFVEWYRLDYLQKKSIKKYNRLAGESQGYHYRNEDVEISLYEFVQSKSYLPCIRRDVIYTTTYADTDDNRHRRSGTFYRNKKFNYADFEEEKSIYS